MYNLLDIELYRNLLQYIFCSFGTINHIDILYNALHWQYIQVYFVIVCLLYGLTENWQKASASIWGLGAQRPTNDVWLKL